MALNNRHRMTDLQNIVMYAMLPDEMIANHPAYPVLKIRDVLASVYRYEYNALQHQYTDVVPEPLTFPIDRLKWISYKTVKLGIRNPSKRYPDGKSIWVDTSVWISPKRKASGWHENLAWFISYDMPMIHDNKMRNRWATYRDHPLRLGAWRLMLPSEVRDFCDISELEWQTWIQKNISTIISQVG